MNRMKRVLVWLRRLPYSRGFRIQSPTDYAFVRYVINEHDPYYAYQQFKELSDKGLSGKLGRLYFRLANWRQPSMMLKDEYEAYWKAGCRKVQWVSALEHVELVRIKMEGDYRRMLPSIYNKVDAQSVLVVEGISRDWAFWHEVEKDPRTGVTFDLYDCGIVFFDTKRHKMNYKVNF